MHNELIGRRQQQKNEKKRSHRCHGDGSRIRPKKEKKRTGIDFVCFFFRLLFTITILIVIMAADIIMMYFFFMIHSVSAARVRVGVTGVNQLAFFFAGNIARDKVLTPPASLRQPFSPFQWPISGNCASACLEGKK